MITLTARIELLKSGIRSGESGIISDISLSPNPLSGNNVSALLRNVIGYKAPIKKPFVFGKSVLGGGDKYFDYLDYFMGNQLSAENGNFANPYTISVMGSNIRAITFAFDDLNGAYPKSMIVDGTEYVDDDPLWTMVLRGNSKHTFIISNWNKPDSPLVISGIYINLDIKIDRRNVVKIERGLFDRADISLPSYGIISNTGRIEFNDIDGEVRDYAELQILNSGLNVEISVENTPTKAKQVIGVLKTADWNYDSYDKEVSVELKDDLEEWQEINVAEIYFDLKSYQSKTLKYFYEYLYNKTPSKYNMLTFTELDSKTQDILNNTVIQYPYLEKGTLWQQWTKLCEVAQLHIYKQNTRTICIYNEGN